MFLRSYRPPSTTASRYWTSAPGRLISGTLWVTFLLASGMLSPPAARVLALSCAACDPDLCSDTAHCPGGLVMDICRCCQVCARVKDQKCGGLFGILGKCDRNLHCFLTPLDGQPITGHEEGVCKEIPEMQCSEPHCPPVYESQLCPTDSYLTTSEEGNQPHGQDHPREQEEAREKNLVETKQQDSGQTLWPEHSSYCVCNTSLCTAPICAPGFLPRLARISTGVPGSCCDVYTCNKSLDCESVMCPPLEDGQCPEGSTRPPPRWTDDHCCQLQQACACPPRDHCPPVSCPLNFQLQVTLRATGRPGSCCDKFVCVNETGQTCTYNGREINNGETWQIDKCKTCECRDGLNRCRDRSCGNVSCTWMVIPEGECCPVCRGCVSDSGDLYNELDVWRENDCTTCTCRDGHVQCQSEMCTVQCARPQYLPGQCCPVCPDHHPAPVVSECPDLDSCHLNCKHGLERDHDGCPLCRCKEESCDLTCPRGLKTGSDGRPICECREEELGVELVGARCPWWQRQHCDKKCEYGFKRTKDGCVKCKCRKCPHLQCNKRCVHGFSHNDEGCPVCRCREVAIPDLLDSNSEPELVEGRSCLSRHGARHENAESWNDGCRLCYCHDGLEMCSLIACPAPHCSNPIFRIGDCCPTCPGITATTTPGERQLCQSSQGHYYVEGESWHMDSCTQCVCHGGSVLCSVPSCPPVFCHHPVKPEGACCATCPGDDFSSLTSHGRPEHCLSTTGVVYQHREIWQPTSCQSCICQDGQISCYHQMCAPVNCNKTVLRQGQCCTTCVETSTPKLCSFHGQTYASGEKWQGDNCTQCLCVAGLIECFPLHCPRLDCDVMVRKRDQCCPECYDKSHSQSHISEGQQAKHVNHTVLPKSSATVDGNIVGFSVLGVLLFLLAMVIVLLVFYLLSRKKSRKFGLRPKSTNLELQGQMPFIPEQNTKTVNSEKQFLEKLCPGITVEKVNGDRVSNDYTEIVFREVSKEPFRDDNEHYLHCLKS